MTASAGRYAARLNAFKPAGAEDGPAIARMIDAAGRVGGLDAADLNYPDHFTEFGAPQIAGRLADNGMSLNGLAMRYYTDPGFALGAFTNPDARVRQAAVDITKAGIDVVAEMGGGIMTLWMGQDGFDYAMQGDYRAMWDSTIEALRAVADHNPDIDIAIEYKPNEPRAYALMPDVGTTLLGVLEADRANIGVTLDFAHVLYADEMPAHSAHLIGRHSRLLGVHLNDGNAKRDDGLMVGTVHPVATVELFCELERIGSDEYAIAATIFTYPELFSNWQPTADICETDDEYLIKADLPNVDRNDIKLTVDNGIITIKGERHQNKEEKNERTLRTENFYGSFSRGFSLPSDVDASRIRTSKGDSGLTVHLPKSESRPSHAIE